LRKIADQTLEKDKKKTYEFGSTTLPFPVFFLFPLSLVVSPLSSLPLLINSLLILSLLVLSLLVLSLLVLSLVVLTLVVLSLLVLSLLVLSLLVLSLLVLSLLVLSLSLSSLPSPHPFFPCPPSHFSFFRKNKKL
jgi:hypothetical protein